MREAAGESSNPGFAIGFPLVPKERCWSYKL